MFSWLRWVFLLVVFCPAWSAYAQVCAAPGASGSATIAAINTVINTYYPGTAAGGAAAGTTIGYTSASGRGSGTAIAAGDLVLVVQMQDGTGGTTANNNTYAFPATNAGKYEFVRVLSLGANVLNLTTALTNSYVQNTTVANNQTYQVIRVPQYATLTINAASSIVPMPWDGGTGGLVVADVAGVFTNNGSIDASYAGFRGSAGVTLAGVAGATALTTANLDYVRPDTYAAHGGKGEGIAGTPDRVMNVFASAGVLLTKANGTSTNLTTTSTFSITTSSPTFTNLTGRSYNAGSRAAGAPANAGGGGDDSAPANNGENSGGGGGGSFGAGGVGGNTWNTNQAIGGRGGVASAPAITGRLILGGGGGSGTSNDNYNVDTSGGAGGGVIFIKAGSLAGGGSLIANGQAGRSIPQLTAAQCPANSVSSCDGAGGGGGGGGIVVLASSGTVANALVRGGQGGNIAGTQHGPGGGGGGGYVVTSSVLTLSASTLAGGVAGLTNLNGGAGTAYGAGAGAAGNAATVANGAGVPAVAGGLPANCLPALTVSKVTSTPAASTSISPPSTTTYSIVVSNAAGSGDAMSITIYEPTLPGGSVTVVNPPLPTSALSVAPSSCGLSARSAIVDPVNGATSTWTAGTWSLPGGCAVTYTFTVNVPVTVPNGTYSNSAVAWFKDPTDTSGTRTVTAALPPAATGLTANTSFTTGGAVGGRNYDGSSGTNTAEDILVQRKANVAVAKTDGTLTVLAGSTTTYTITVANLGPADASGTVLRDPGVPGLNCTTVSCTSTSANMCPAVLTVSALQTTGLQVTPTFPANSTASFVLTCGVTATGQ